MPPAYRKVSKVSAAQGRVMFSAAFSRYKPGSQSIYLLTKPKKTKKKQPGHQIVACLDVTHKEVHARLRVRFNHEKVKQVCKVNRGCETEGGLVRFFVFRKFFHHVVGFRSSSICCEVTEKDCDVPQ